MQRKAILENDLTRQAVFILSVVILSAVMALVVQVVIGITAAHGLPVQYCHFWCSEYGQCFWVCD
ncbi:hypothetical protein [Methanoregula sp.]|uniref:hypothetical protein n=1 Tax=Methanoregula sp. TaxID=2052170 RepID=UPI002C0F9309|nr:hypothetical protein [Methanoregula sp.]HVP96132.1 hypothetical protein [Methanoregula sp.]